MDDLAHLIAPDDDPPEAVIQQLVWLNLLTTPEDVRWRRVPRVKGVQHTTCECGRFVRLFVLELSWPMRYLAHIGQCQACGTISWWGITLR
ncbi:MAG: hypothetical protein M5U01_10065 [Ardenticatenaceae bacterium]|nr:hypothetical protein [Ardenticatenaceae bacterium]